MLILSKVQITSPLSLLTHNTIHPNKMNTPDTILHQQAYDVMETIEDSVEHLCHEYMLSGEKVWTMISALSEAKLDQFPVHD